MIQLNDRDYTILKQVYRWRVCLGRHIKELAGFDGQRACDRRLKKLIEAGYLERKKILYGLPSLYFVTHKGKVLINVPRRADKIKLEQINHDIAVLDVAIFLIKSKGISISQIITERELHSIDGFGNRGHRPDFVINNNEKTMCVEIELNPKGKARTETIIRENFLTYDKQLWVVPHKGHKVAKMLDTFILSYPNMKTISIEDINKPL